MKARLTPEADLDARQAIRWYDERSRQLGDLVHRQMRRALVQRFPYEVIYEIENNEIIIYAIYHCARDPEIWRRRRDA